MDSSPAARPCEASRFGGLPRPAGASTICLFRFLRSTKDSAAMRILVADKLAEEGLDFLKQSGMDFDTKIGLKEDELAGMIGQYDAMVVRSGVKATAKVLAI